MEFPNYLFIRHPKLFVASSRYLNCLDKNYLRVLFKKKTFFRCKCNEVHAMKHRQKPLMIHLLPLLAVCHVLSFHGVLSLSRLQTICKKFARCKRHVRHKKLARKKNTLEIMQNMTIHVSRFDYFLVQLNFIPCMRKSLALCIITASTARLFKMRDKKSVS